MEWLTPDVLLTGLSIISTILAAIFGKKFVKYRKLLVTVAKAYSDGKIDDVEAQEILNQINQLGVVK